MQNPVSRRMFLKTAGALTAGLTGLGARGLAIEPFLRQGPPRLTLSLAAYSFRQFFGDDAKIPPAKRLDLFGFMDFCAEHGCQATELTSYYFPKTVTEEFLLRIRRHAFLKGLAISGTAVGNTFTLPDGEKRLSEIAHVDKWIEYARIMGAPHIRVFAGTVPQGVTLDQAKRNCIAALEHCGEVAGRAGIFLGVENHGGIVAEPADLLEIIRAVKSPWVGINLDTGNFHTEDPYKDLAACAPYAVNVQLKVEMSPRGQPKGPVDLARIVKLLKETNYQGYFALEYEAAEDPWTEVPRYLRAMKEAIG